MPLDHYLPPGTASGTIREEALPENALQFNQDELGLLHPRPQSPSLSDSELPSAETGQPSTAAPSSPPSKLARYRMSAPHLPPRSSPHAPLLDPIAPERKLDPKQATERDVKIAEHVLEEFRLHAIPRGLWTERSYRECLESLQEPVPTDMRLNMSQASYALRRDRDFAQVNLMIFMEVKDRTCSRVLILLCVFSSSVRTQTSRLGFQITRILTAKNGIDC